MENGKGSIFNVVIMVLLQSLNVYFDKSIMSKTGGHSTAFLLVYSQSPKNP